jgi:hypothetical protein
MEDFGTVVNESEVVNETGTIRESVVDAATEIVNEVSEMVEDGRKSAVIEVPENVNVMKTGNEINVETVEELKNMGVTIVGDENLQYAGAIKEAMQNTVDALSGKSTFDK